MRFLYALLGLIALSGCATIRDKPAQGGDRTNLLASDVELVRHFLDALYRPASTAYRVIPDAESEEESMRHIPLAKRNRNLSDRLNQLRHAPFSVLRINTHSGDRPKPWGSGIFVFSYSTRNGEFTFVRPHEIGDASANMWVDVRHWPDGTRLVCLSLTWIDDSKNNIFHLRSGQETFRFAIASEPDD